MKCKSIIENIQIEKSDYKYESQAIDQARGLDLLSSDVFSEYIRFLFELIQNADDAGAKDVNIEVSDSFIIVSHDGDGFTEDDVRSICSVGSGTKKTNTNTTGYKGIGFKSVFGKSNYVVIFSEGFQFRFDETYQHPQFKIMPWQIIPQWTDINDLPQDIRNNFPNKWNVSTTIRLNVTIEVINDLSELLRTSQVLLFLRNLTKISATGKLETVIEKKDNETGIVELIRNSTEKSTWLVKQFQGELDEDIKQQLRDHRNPDNRNIPEKVRFQESYDISFAAKVEKNKIVSLNQNETLIFTYLPTKVKSFVFPFLINSNFLVDTSRENLHEDNAWNHWLMKTSGEKVIEWIVSLNSTKHSMEVLHLLPDIRFSNSNKLNSKFFNSFIKFSESIPFIPTENGLLETPNKLIIDRTGLADQDFISEEAIVEYINKVADKNYTVNSFVNSKLESKNKLNNLGAFTFDLDNLEDFFVNDIFKANHLPSQNFSLIKYFFEQSTNSNNKEANEKLKELPFIYAQGKKLKSPKQLMFPTNADLDIEIDEEIVNSIPKIHKEVNSQIQNHTQIRLWLINLGVKESEENLEAIIENVSDIITRENYKTITRFLFNMDKQGKLVPYYRSLSKLKLLTTKDRFCLAGDCYLSNFYEPIFNIEDYYDDGNYISHEYKEQTDLPSEWKTFFIRIGVSESISWIVKSFTRYELHDKFPSYFEIIPSGVPNSSFGIKNDFYRYDMNIISFIELATRYTFSKIFWELIFKGNIPYYSNKNDMGICYYPARLLPLNEWIIRNMEIFPTTKQKKCLKASEVFINSKEIIEVAGKYLPVFDCLAFPSNYWIDHLPFKKILEIEDYLKIIEEIELDTEKDDELNNKNKKRLGLIYNRLSSQITIISDEKKNQIAEWADCHKILCDNGNFENAKELKWINIDGFTNTSEHIKLLFIPENCETNTNDFEELLKLFGVKIIDSFIPDIKDKEPNATLKIQLQVVLPFFTAILERKHYLDYSVEFKRLATIIDNTEFYNASEIVLSFKNQDEIILGPSLSAYLDDSELSFKGKWTSPITLYALIPEITKLLDLTGSNDELSLLLQLEETDIEEWITSQGYEVERIKETEEFRISRRNIEDIVVKEGIQNIGIISTDSINKFQHIEDILKRNNITLKQLEYLIENYDSQYEEIGGHGSNSDIAKQRQIEDNEEARKLVMQKLTTEKYIFTQGIGSNSVVNGVYKNDKEFPLVVKSYKNSSWKFKINPNEWIQLSKPNAMFWVHRGGGHLEFLELKGLLRANSEFFVRFETDTFTLDDLVNFASVFRFVRNVHFQLDAPNFSAAKAFEDYRFYERNLAIKQEGGDNIKIIE